jgi:protocatechuate 3,4-dioxygenase beta subunit
MPPDRAITPHHTTGPFFPRRFVPDRQSDLTRVADRAEPARGIPLELGGTVRDGKNRPVVNAIIELHQADAAGRFGADRDRGFAGWGRAWTDQAGGYRFHTIKPGSYRAAASRSWIRPPHFTVVVLGSGIMRPLVTEIFLPGEPENDGDRQLARLSARLRPRLFAALVDSAPLLRYRFDFVLQGRGETPFLGS